MSSITIDCVHVSPSNEICILSATSTFSLIPVISTSFWVENHAYVAVIDNITVNITNPLSEIISSNDYYLLHGLYVYDLNASKCLDGGYSCAN